MSKHYTVVVILEAKPGCEAQLESALTAVVNPSRAEKACVEYRVHRCIENPAQFIFYENWDSKEKHLEHMEQPHLERLGKQLENLLAQAPLRFFAHEFLAI